MDIQDAIFYRRSIRKYTDETVSDEQVTCILEAAMMAPSAGNAQPWQFVVVRDKEKLSQIKDINPYAGMAEKAQVGILVCGDLSLEKYSGFWVQDCSAAVQNLLLSVHNEGLGAVWTGVYPLEERVEGFRKLFKLPENVIPLAFMPIGHPGHTPKSEPRFLKDRVHQDGWQG
ncbi:nitroreductase [Desulfoluna limicola]|uniref:Nitroreductase n=1 Tax=Desulfoluna limicola TaxID=2810562 RepID=A0ABM7PCF2_9BACT|nr:nitroreductase family protein [Desulfoluna limicola]BCS95250.1 nitroreductase [Desulfoluna limicola]